MNEISVSIEDIRRLAYEFRQASEKSQQIVKDLSDANEEIRGKWLGISQQAFYRQYQEWNQIMIGLSAMMNQINRELNCLADNIEKADK